MQPGKYNNLIAQLSKLYRHNRQGSFKTKERYYEVMQHFCQFLAGVYSLEKLSNIAPKHLRTYVEYMQDSNLAPATIKTDLSGIRFFHDKISDPRHQLPPNSELGLERRQFGGEDKTWDQREFSLMIIEAMKADHEDYVTALTLAYYAGLRIEELFTIDTAMSEKALREGAITFHGKGGKWRTVPINDSITIQLRKMLDVVQRGQKLLTPANVTVETAMSGFRHFIYRNRDKVKTPERGVNLTIHGLRHSFARNTYLNLIEQGKSHDQACQQVSIWLGHERKDVTRIYLASVFGDGEHHV